MIWSNWQGAAWRGAIVVVLIWSGLAWTQAPVQHPGDPAERIMVVHENGRKIRCRVEETWQLPDGRVAHLLQAVETGEKITIVDDQAATLDPAMKSSRAVPKRIFAWGLGRKTPPDGSPMPPHLRLDSGIVINQETPPSGQQATSTIKASDTQLVEFQKVAPTSAGAVHIIQSSDPEDKSMPPIIQIADAPPPIPVPMAPVAPGAAGMPVPQLPTLPMTAPVAPVAPAATVPQIFVAPSLPIAAPSAPVVLPSLPTAAPSAPGISPSAVVVPSMPSPGPGVPAAAPTNVVQAPGAPCAGSPIYVDDPSMTRPWRPGDKIIDWLQNRNGTTVVREIPGPTVTSPGVQQPSVALAPTVTVVGDPRVVQDPTPEPERKPWRPGERIVNFFTGKSPAPKTETVKAPDGKAPEMSLTLPKSAEELKLQKTEDFLAQENKQLEKKMQEKVAKAPAGPFSTATGIQPEVKKSDTPLVIPGAVATADKNASPPPLPTDIKPAAEKKDMWGLGLADSVLPPGKPVEAGKVPSVMQTRVNDPLTMPERFVDKRGAFGPMTAADMAPGDPSMGGYPLGSQSVLAARSGMLGQVTYVPVPTVTVPQPFNPPLPPEPKMPSPPELNAYVNAFTPPPQPKGTQEYPMQGMMPAQAMNPAMQQQMAMQQYMMQQQMMQQQTMNPYANRPSPYPPMVSQGPTMNFARQYQGPQAPNPVGPGPVMPAGYAPMPYPPMQPQQQPMMPQQQPVQQVGMQQPAVPQVDQLIKVLRESPYPAQREWAAQSLSNFEWRVHPQIVPSLLQSARQDPAGSVRAGCVFSLGRLQAAVEPVVTTLNAMRNDIDPRVRQEVQQTLVRFGQTN